MRAATRRSLCRLGFLGLCLIPTLAVCCWAVAVQTPSYIDSVRAQWAERLQQHLGVRVSVGSVDQPSWAVTRLWNLKLHDTETQSLIGEIRVLEISQSEGELLVRASQPELHGAHANRLWAAVYDRLLLGGREYPIPVRFYAGELTIHRSQDGRGTTGVTLTEVECVLDEDSAGPQLAAYFQIAGQPATDFIELHAARDRQSHPPRTRWVLDTGTSKIPCDAFADQLPGLHWLGDDSTFRGRVDANLSSSGWNGEARGVLDQVDLDRLVRERFGPRLGGQARVVLEDCKFRESGLERMTGRVTSRGGVIDGHLLAKATDHLRLQSRKDVRREVRYSFAELGLNFELDAQSLVITGNCQSQQEAVLVDKRGPLLWQSAEPLSPVRALAGLLGPPNTNLVSATQATEVLIRVLPLPSVVPPRDATAERPAVRLADPSAAARASRPEEHTRTALIP